MAEQGQFYVGETGQRIKQIMGEGNRPQGWSAKEMTDELSKRGWLSPLDSVLDIHDEMRKVLGPPSPPPKRD